MWWFTTSEDRQHTFEGIARFFDAVGGIPAANRTDRMGALGRPQGRRFVLHPPTVGFAAHHATTITSCKARDAKRKGKVERPFRQLQDVPARGRARRHPRRSHRAEPSRPALVAGAGASAAVAVNW